MFLYNLFSRFGFLLEHVIDENTKHELAGTATEAAAAVTEAAANGAAAANPAGDPMSIIPTIVMWVIVGVGFYFLLFRQPRKEQKAKQALRESIKIGDSVLTIAGFYGKVVDIGTDVFVIELGNNRGVRVAVKKEAIEAISEPILTPPAREATDN